MSDDLEVLAPTGASVKFRGKDMEVLPIPVGALPKLVREARPLADELMSLELPADGDDTALFALVLNLIEQHGERIFVAAAICTGKDQKWIEGADIADFVQLAIKVFEVNRDFFVLKLAPLLGVVRAAAAMGGVGQTPSSSSSSVDTA